VSDGALDKNKMSVTTSVNFLSGAGGRTGKDKKGQGIQSAVGIAQSLPNTVADDDGIDGA